MNTSLTPKMELKEDVVLVGGKYVKSKEFSKEIVRLITEQQRGAFRDDLYSWKRRYDKYTSQNTKTKRTLSHSKDLYIAWEEMNKKYLGNIPIELLVTLEGDGYTEAKGLHYKVESDAFSPKTKDPKIGVNTSIIKKSLNNQSIKYGSHYDYLARTILKEKPTKKEIWEAENHYKKINWQKWEQLNSAYWTEASKRFTFAEQVYGRKSEYNSKVGRIVEVFFNHLAQMHASNIKIINNNGIKELDINSNGTVRQEEWPNLLRNMYLWQDNDKYIAGGDINIADASGKILVKVQLKSTSKGSDLRELGDTIGHEVDLGIIYNYWVCPFIEWCETPNDKILKSIANKLKTSVWVPLEEEINKGIEVNINNLKHYVNTQFNLGNKKRSKKKKKKKSAIKK